MDPRSKAALLVAIPYVQSPYPTLRWATADALAAARHLERFCGFKRIFLLHRRPGHLFTEGESGEVHHLARLLMPPTGSDPRSHLIRELLSGLEATYGHDEYRELAAFNTQLRELPPGIQPSPGQIESIESLMVSMLNRWILREPSEASARHERLLHEFPLLRHTPNPDSVIQFLGVPTRQTITNAVTELHRDAATMPGHLAFTLIFGHGVNNPDGQNCLVLPDSDQDHLNLTSIRIQDLIHSTGTQALFIDACQVHAASNSKSPRSPQPGQRVLVGLPAESDGQTWKVSTPTAPDQGTVALLHTCWPGKPANELAHWRHGMGTRFLLESLQGRAWRSRSSPTPVQSTPPEAELDFLSLAIQLGRDLRDTARRLAAHQSNDQFRQEAYLHTVGVADAILLAHRKDPITQDPRIWIHPPRFADIVGNSGFIGSLGIPFVHLADSRSLIARWTVRNRDFEPFLLEPDGSASGNPTGGSDPDLPRVHVTHASALAYCRWLTQREVSLGILPPTGFAYDLPTDDEWDLAVGILPIQHLAPSEKLHQPRKPWTGENPPAGFCFAQTRPLPVHETVPIQLRWGAKASLQELCGLAGNVWELTLDPYDPNDPDRFTVRGQSFRTPLDKADVTRREARYSDTHYDDVGFRLVLRRTW